MNSTRIFSLAATALVTGGLFAGSIGWAAAQEHPIDGMGGAAAHGSGMIGPGMMGGMMSDMMGDMMGDMMASHGAGMMDAQHTQMQAAVAEALGLTAEEFQAELEAGKMVPQIAEEQGVSLADLHETVMSQFGMNGR